MSRLWKAAVPAMAWLTVGAGRALADEDFLPAPAAPAGGAAPAAPVPVTPTIPITVAHVGLDTTKLVIGVAILLVLALILFFVRGGIKSALISRKASLDAANFAGWSWFLYLLLFLGLIVFGLLGGFFGLMVYTISTASLGVIGLITCLVISGNAGATRK